MPNLPEYEFTVTAIDSPSGMTSQFKVVASYFQEQGSMLLFKAADHTVVEGHLMAMVPRVVRGARVVDA